MHIFDRPVHDAFEIIHEWTDPDTLQRRFAVRFYTSNPAGRPVREEVIRSFDAAEFAEFMLSPTAPQELQWLKQVLAACATEVEYHDREDA